MMNPLRCARAFVSHVSVTALALATVLQTAPLATGQSQALAQDSSSRNYVRITEANASLPRTIRLGLNKSIVVDLPSDANDVLVANPVVADAVMRTSRRIYLFGKQQGQTNIFIFDGAGKQIAAMEITIERDISGLEATINRLIPNANVRAEIINGSVVLTGSVATPSDATKAVELATIFVNSEQSTSIFQQISERDIVNLIKIDGQDQVQLRVTIAEVARSVVKQLGIQTAVQNTANNGFAFSAFGAPSLSQGANIGSLGTLGVTHGANLLQATLTAMETAGVVRMLAEPNLTAVSGESATFRVGGTWQVPSNVSQEEVGGPTTVTYTEQEYGIELDFTPVVLTEGRISLRLRTQVEEPSPVGAGVLPAGGLPGTRRREASTTVELPSGGSMAIAGLVKDDIRQSIGKVPGLGKIPVLGTLFRSREFIRAETELVMIVTPYLVRPTSRAALAQPDAGFQPASDAASMFMGRVNRVYGTKQGEVPKGRYTGSIGFILK